MRIAGRDHEAFAEVYRRYGATVRAPALVVCGPACADEVVQDIFLRLWQRPASFDPDRGSLRSFLAMQAHGRAVDRVRSDAARRSRETADLTRAPRTSADVEAAALAGLVRTEMSGLLATLPRGEREAITVAYVGGYTYQEVARLLHQPEGTIKSRIRTGLQRLRSGMAAQANQAEVTLKAR